jgi:Leucine Rich repeat
MLLTLVQGFQRSCLLLQLADFLRADARPCAAAFCSAILTGAPKHLPHVAAQATGTEPNPPVTRLAPLPAGSPAAAAHALLARQHADTVDAIMRGLPLAMSAPPAPLTTALAHVPRHAHAAAARAYAAAAVGDVTLLLHDAEMCQTAAKHLVQAPELSSLCLRSPYHNAPLADDVFALAPLVAALTQVTALRLELCSDTIIRTLCPKITAMTQLRSLRLPCLPRRVTSKTIECYSQGSKVLARVSALASLTELHLSGCALDPAPLSNQRGERLGACVAKVPALARLTLEYAHQKDPHFGSEAFGGALAALSQLTFLRLTGIREGQSTVRHMRGATSLLHLELESEPQHVSTSWFDLHVGAFTQLTYLSLSNFKMGKREQHHSQWLAQALATPSLEHLVELRLHRLRPSDNNAEVLVLAFGLLPCLEHLAFTGGFRGERAAQAAGAGEDEGPAAQADGAGGDEGPAAQAAGADGNEGAAPLTLADLLQTCIHKALEQKGADPSTDDPDTFEGQRDLFWDDEKPAPWYRNKAAAAELGLALTQAVQLTPLTSLDLSGAFDIRQRTAEGADTLARHVMELTVLQALNLSRTSFGPAGAASLADGLPALTRLTALRLDTALRHCGGDGRQALLAALGGLSALAALGLSHSSLGDAGAAALAPALGALTALTSLGLHSNGFSAQGAAALTPQLARRTALVQLDLRGNPDIDDEGVAALCVQLTGLAHLEHVDEGLAWEASLLPYEERETRRTVAKLTGLECDWVDKGLPFY